jgi:hypothetical protein
MRSCSGRQEKRMKIGELEIVYIAIDEIVGQTERKESLNQTKERIRRKSAADGRAQVLDEIK